MATSKIAHRFPRPDWRGSEGGEGVRAGPETPSAERYQVTENDDDEVGIGTIATPQICKIFCPWRSCTEGCAVMEPSFGPSENPQKGFPQKADQGFDGRRLLLRSCSDLAADTGFTPLNHAALRSSNNKVSDCKISLKVSDCAIDLPQLFANCKLSPLPTNVLQDNQCFLSSFYWPSLSNYLLLLEARIQRVAAPL